MIRVLFTIPNFDTAGSGKVVYDIASRLDPHKFEVEIACNHSRGMQFERIKSLGLPIHLVQFAIPTRPYLTFLGRLWALTIFFKRGKFDIVHSWHWSSDWSEALAARLAGAKWLYTKKAMGWDNLHWKFRSLLANYIICLNDDMNAFFPWKRNCSLIPLGIDVAEFYPSERKLAAIPFRIVFVANLVSVKGVDVLIKAIAMMKIRDVHVDIIGDCTTSYGIEMQNLCRLEGLESLFTFHGKLPDVKPLVRESHLFAITSVEPGEGMPMALVEAMAQGILCIGSNVAGVRFVLKEFPQYLFEAGNAKALAGTIERIMSQPDADRVKVGIQMRNYCVENFEMSRFIKAHEELYSRLTI